MSERPFYGWVVLAAAFVIITMSIGTLFTLGVFLKPIEDSMGWSRSGIGAISFFNWTVMGGGGLLAGYVSDRLGTRPVVLAGAGLLGLGLVLSSYVQEVWQLYVTFGQLVGRGGEHYLLHRHGPRLLCRRRPPRPAGDLSGPLSGLLRHRGHGGCSGRDAQATGDGGGAATEPRSGRLNARFPLTGPMVPC